MYRSSLLSRLIDLQTLEWKHRQTLKSAKALLKSSNRHDMYHLTRRKKEAYTKLQKQIEQEQAFMVQRWTYLETLSQQQSILNSFSRESSSCILDDSQLPSSEVGDMTMTSIDISDESSEEDSSSDIESICAMMDTFISIDTHEYYQDVLDHELVPFFPRLHRSNISSKASRITHSTYIPWKTSGTCSNVFILYLML